MSFEGRQIGYRLAAILAVWHRIIHWTQWQLIALLLAVGGTPALAQSGTEQPPYTELFYPSGPLRVQAYLYGRRVMDLSFW